MKENNKNSKLLRVALVLCVVALFFGSFAGATLAKYTTASDVNETARAAQWGVTVTTWTPADAANDADNLFKNEYASTTQSGHFVVKAATATADEKLVAPGLSNTTGVNFTITGDPEVATKITYDFTYATDVYLDLNTAESDTVGYGVTSASDAYTATPSTNTNYYPVKFTLTKDGTAVVTNGNLADIKAYFDYVNAGAELDVGEGKNGEFDPNTTLDVTYNLTWAWAFEDTANAATVNVYDTTLGNLIDGMDQGDYLAATSGVDKNWCGNIEFALEVTVEQIRDFTA